MSFGSILSPFSAQYASSQLADRACTACGRTQRELERQGATLRFLCPDDVCTICLGESGATAA